MNRPRIARARSAEEKSRSGAGNHAEKHFLRIQAFGAYRRLGAGTSAVTISEGGGGGGGGGGGLWLDSGGKDRENRRSEKKEGSPTYT
ncbi:hypothetical protein C1H46_021818 [Malus baccata]|uniref:Uncharacterized protein n=1 Tax=Malus baccata TaxID=106549 RepID=A0A540M1K0_MALBA|nr:hypothetical protein C1H46_021818 [Malus baccata]